METIKAAHMEVYLYLVVPGILILLVIAMLKRNRDRNESNDHPLETVRVDGEKKQKVQEHLLTEENDASSTFNCLKRCSKRKHNRNEPNDRGSSTFNCLKSCSKRKHNRNEPNDRDKKQKEQEHLLTEENDGSRKDKELEGKKQDQIKGEQVESKKRKLAENLVREEEERQNEEEKLRREEAKRPNQEEKLRREEERQNREENLRREEERQNREENLRREEKERQNREENLRREEEERQNREENLRREEEERKNKQKPKGNIGLRNQGATCYLNSVLQILFMTEDFRNTVRNTEIRVNPIDFHIAQLFTDLKSGKKGVATTERITDVLNVNVYEQQDAAEYFQKIMNMVNPEMSKVFQGELEHNTMCKNPGKEHPLVTRHESFYIFPICMETYAFDSTINMQSCFDSCFEPIKTCEDDQVKCPTCKEPVDTEIKCSIHKLPAVLVVQLERFQLDYYTMNYKKNNSTVEIQFQLSVKNGRGDQHKYDLYAVVKHSGSFHGGHYYAVIKSFEDHQWYEFNDSTVRQIDDLLNPFHCNKAYFLLYKKSSNESENVPQDPDNRSEDENNETDAKANTIR